ncbi:hypothetical protein [Burkholderia thailandensis]|uniref:Uncharacterized protein n=1 Tax=Burkholderia thailandensis TaxID=57975 RepID=A0AAW9D5H4_BURTH|nr:hypothetical protein [Burkholderia thailandensis]AVR27008.1 hypothetical protein A8H32_09505 [Burkholderia thailandensis]MDD1478907.1 hypothetical protein [Burkholderia thailandensis]MDD1486056.1 hypothetical protein [Burkholderia thailandensis]MDD1490778.1 hypothetical protein [Burkholderia thailandensis]MDW9238051.1 hypothetical protein [Burkholderia thailandensis]
MQRGHAGRSSHEPDEAGKLESWVRPCRRTNGASLVEKLHTRNLAAQQNNRRCIVIACKYGTIT